MYNEGKCIVKTVSGIKYSFKSSMGHKIKYKSSQYGFLVHNQLTKTYLYRVILDVPNITTFLQLSQILDPVQCLVW